MKVINNDIITKDEVLIYIEKDNQRVVCNTALILMAIIDGYIPTKDLTLDFKQLRNLEKIYNKLNNVNEAVEIELEDSEYDLMKQVLNAIGPYLTNREPRYAAMIAWERMNEPN